MPRIGFSALTLGLSLVPALVPAAPAAANMGTIKIAAVSYDAVPGPDPRTNAYFNREYVVIRNTGTASRQLSGYTLRDLKRASCNCVHVYRFGRFVLRPGKTVRIHTGKGTNTATDRYWGLTSYVWGDDSDSAILKNSRGSTLWSCAWSTANTSPKYC